MKSLRPTRRLGLWLASVCLFASGLAGYLMGMPRPLTSTTEQQIRDGKPASARLAKAAEPTRVIRQLTTVAVVTQHPGMSAEEMEQAVTIPLENSLDLADGRSRIESKTGRGVSMVQIHFQDTPPAVALAQAAGLTGIVIPQFPPGTPRPKLFIVDPANVLPACLLRISSTDLTLAEVAELAGRRIRPELFSLTDVSAAEIAGAPERVLLIRFDPDRLRANRLSPNDVIDTLRKGNQIHPQGDIVIGDKTKNLVVGYNIKDLGNIPIKPDSNVYLRDVATLADGSGEPTTLVRVNGRRQAVVSVRGKRGAAPAAAREAVKKELGKLTRRLPDSAHMEMLSLGRGDNSETGLITIHLRADPGSRLEACEKLVMQVEAFLDKHIPAAERQWLLAELGPDDGVSLVGTGRTEAHHATLRLQLAASQAAKTIDHVNKLRREFRAAFPAVQASFHAGAGATWPVTVQVGGGSSPRLQKLSSQVRERLLKLPEAADVVVAEAMPRLVVEVDRAKAGLSGITAADVARSLVAATSASRYVLPNLWRDPDSGMGYRVQLEIPLSLMSSSDQLDKVPLRQGKDKEVLLRDVARIRQADETCALIERCNQARVVTIRVNGADAAVLARAIEENLQDLPVPEGMWVKVVTAP
jgi:multidrug efflux pump subunit AcrB